MADVEVKVINLEFVEKQIGKIPDDIFSYETLTELGLFFTSAIKMRTARGVDFQGRPFKPYSAKYAAFRENAGFGSSTVDLFFSGAMTSAMQSEALVSQKAVRLFFLDTTDKSGVRNPVKAAGLNKDRRFFAVSDEDIRQAIEIIKRKV